jgi:GxxExxY protein
VTVIDLSLEDNQLTQAIMDCLFKVHSTMGPGLLESVYEECLCHEMSKRNIACERQKAIPLRYDGHILQQGMKIGLLVSGRVILELKSVESILPIHKAQLLTYLKLANLPIGFLVNFNVPLIKNGVQRFVNNHDRSANSASPR